MLSGLAALALLAPAPLRPPSVPLVTHDPYFSIWSPADRATDRSTAHWTGRPQELEATLSVDGQRYRLLGEGSDPALPQTSLEITATRTTYTFANAAIEARLSFVSPLLPDSLDVYSRPVTYVQIATRSLDGRSRDLAVTFSASGNLAVDEGRQRVETALSSEGPVRWARVGTAEQPILQKRGDDLRIDWGYAYLASDARQGWSHAANRTRAAGREVRLTATRQIGSAKRSDSWLMIAYDDLLSIRYFDQDHRPYWRRKGLDGPGVLRVAARERTSVLRRAEAFDARMARDLRAVGGEKYAQIAILAYRQAVAGNKLVADAKGRPLMFPKENFSNGCVATVDVIYPMAPLFFMLGSDLARAMLVPVLDYGSSPRWRFPFAPHDLGTYPHATGQVYGGGELTEENQMPVEESGNMLLLVAALAEIEGDASFAKKYWPALTRWAEYLRKEGLDPANQLCTDDFMGHLARNANLSAKAILSLGAYGKLAEALGEAQTAREYRELSQRFAREWLVLAADEGHTRLAFDRPRTWSQKYNLVWDDILGLKVFPESRKRQELASYRTRLNRYGLPLDNRSPGMKVDWAIWTATLTRDRGDFQALVAPVWDFVNETVDRVPISDWVRTDVPKHNSMIARPVIGGVFLPILHDRALWKAWFADGVRGSGDWAPIPIRARTPVVPSARDAAAEWAYTFEEPASGWEQPGFDDSSWKRGPAGFGSQGTPGAVVRTAWTTDALWIRRELVIPRADRRKLRLWVHHDEDAEIWINGVLVAKLSGYTKDYRDVEIPAEAMRAIRFGAGNVIAARCRQTGGGQYLDIALIEIGP